MKIIQDTFNSLATKCLYYTMTDGIPINLELLIYKQFQVFKIAKLEFKVTVH